MKSRYRKSGRTSLMELHHGAVHQLELIEHGEAIERGPLFESRTMSAGIEDGAEPAPIPSKLIELLRELGGACERATVISGVSRHVDHDDEGEREWGESTARLHVSFVNRKTGARCEIERGGRTFDPIWIDDLHEIATAIRDATPGTEHEPAILLAPAVTATIVAILASSSAKERWGEIIQRPREGERDGRGHLLLERPLNDTSPGAFGWFRPSYRIRPRRTPHSLDLETRSVAGAEPEARVIALCGEAQLYRNRLLLPSLVVHSGTGPRLMTLEIDPGTFMNSPVAGSPTWFPLGAGAWGRNLIAGI